MTLTESHIQVEPAGTEEPKPHWFSRDEYFRMAELGLFQNKRVERFEGRILDMSPQNNPHFLAVDLVTDELRKVFGADYWVRAQGPLKLGIGSDPEPDVAVVAGARRSHQVTPSFALLIVEVSDTTLRYDRGDKASLYAKSAINEYWIVNIYGKCLEVRRDPVADSESPLGWRYQSTAILKAGESVSPLAKPDAQIAVSNLLP